MGSCWSEPPVASVQKQSPVYAEKVIPTAPPMYQPPQNQYSQYTYAVKPQQQQIVYQYPQQQYMAYPYQQYQQQYVQQYPPQQRTTTSPATAFVGGLVLGAVLEDILDPTE